MRTRASEPGDDPGPTDDFDPDLGIDDDQEPPDTEDADPPEPDLDDPPDQDPDPEPRRSRSNDTIRSLRTRAQEAERLLNAERENSRRILETRQPPPVDPMAQAREDAAELERVQQMLPHEVARYYADKAARQTQQQIAMAELRGFDRHDTADFQRLCESRPAVAKRADEVERLLNARRQGGDYSLGRRQIAAFLIGDEILRRGPAAANAQRRGAAARVAGQTTRPASGRGDVARGGRGGNQDAADEALLRQTTAGDV